MNSLSQSNPLNIGKIEEKSTIWVHNFQQDFSTAFHTKRRYGHSRKSNRLKKIKYFDCENIASHKKSAGLNSDAFLIGTRKHGKFRAAKHRPAALNGYLSPIVERVYFAGESGGVYPWVRPCVKTIFLGAVMLL